MGLHATAPVRGLLGALLLPFLAAPGPARRDLDVAVPAGSPLDWARSFPALSPGVSPFAKSPAREGDLERSTATVRPRRLEVRASSAQALVRVLTWDLAAHVAWIGPREGAPRTGATGATGLEPARPRFGEPLYWLTLAPLLRLLLHPSDVSRAEVHAHLVELGAHVEDVLAVVVTEPGLRDDVAAVRSLVAAPPGTLPEAPVGETARERMLARFTLEALLREHPYDPEGAFGRELFLFPDEVYPYLLRRTRSAHPFLRRNATAALARFQTPAAAADLVTLAAEAEDPVVLVRAAAGVGRFYAPLDRAALLARLDSTDEPVARVALLGALARAGVQELDPVLLALASEALAAADSDLLLSCLSAWTELRPPKPESETTRFLEELDGMLERSPRSFRPRGPKGTVQADFPDRPGSRAGVLRQLVLLLRTRIQPSDAGLAEELLAALRAPPAADSPAPRVFEFRGSTLGNVAPAARYAYVETLRYLGDEGLSALTQVVKDRSVEDALRAQALVLLPYDERSAEVESFFHGEPAASAGLRELALRWMIRDNDPRWPALALELLRACATLTPGGGDASTRSLYLTAVRALSERGTLGPRDLAPLLVHARAQRQLEGALGEPVRTRVEELVRAAVAGTVIDRLKPGVDALLDFLEEGRAAVLEEEPRRQLRAYVLGALRGARKRPEDRAYHRTVAADLLERLLGYRLSTPSRETGEFDATVLLEEEILLALGRTRRPEASELLLRLLADGRNRLRAHAILAVGMTGVESAASGLARFLLDPDPFVRFCTHETLRHLTGKTLDVDWMFAPRQERDAAAEEYFAWLHEQR